MSRRRRREKIMKIDRENLGCESTSPEYCESSRKNRLMMLHLLKSPSLFSIPKGGVRAFSTNAKKAFRKPATNSPTLPDFVDTTRMGDSHLVKTAAV
jgi:hypothetical protein